MSPTTTGQKQFESYLDIVKRWPTEAARAWAAQAFSEMCGNPQVVAVVLLGSTIRKTDSSFDLDCLYIYEGERLRFPPTPVEVDLRGFNASDVDRLIEEGNGLLVWSIRFGISICERGDYWSRLRNRWLQTLPFPSAEIAEKRAERAELLLKELRDSGDNDAALEQLVTALTHRARAALLRAGVFPASRPELPKQLRNIAEHDLASMLSAAIAERNIMAHRTYEIGS